ncbi:MAG: hypothetical protein ACLTMP_00670 [Eggerthella lenta]
MYYDVSHQKMLQTIIADMMKALREVGAEQTIGAVAAVFRV